MKIENLLIALQSFVFMAITMQPANAQGVSINSTGAAPHPSAQLDVAGTNSGMLIPRVNLATAVFPAPGPATHLIVINTNASYGMGIGAYRNAGTPAAPNWVKWLEPADAWGTRGNAGTNPSTHFIGTTDLANFVIRTGPGGTMATRRRITVPYDTGEDIVVENVRAFRLPTGSLSNPSFRFQGMSATDGFSSPSSTSIAITYGASSVASKYFFTLPGMLLTYNNTWH